MDTRAELKIGHEPGASVTFTVDIVYVHGFEPGRDASLLGGWPFTKFIPHDIPTARIFTWGYNSSLSVNASAIDLLHALTKARGGSQNVGACPNHQMRLWVYLLPVGQSNLPLIFVAHSLGGIVVKAAISEEALHHNVSEGALSHKTVGVIFISTPHRGDPSSVRSFLQNLESYFHQQADTELHDPLARTVEIEDIQRTFKVALSKPLQQLELVSFYEELPSLNGQVVRLPPFVL